MLVECVNDKCRPLVDKASGELAAAIRSIMLESGHRLSDDDDHQQMLGHILACVSMATAEKLSSGNHIERRTTGLFLHSILTLFLEFVNARL